MEIPTRVEQFSKHLSKSKPAEGKTSCGKQPDYSCGQQRLQTCQSSGKAGGLRCLIRGTKGLLISFFFFSVILCMQIHLGLINNSLLGENKLVAFNIGFFFNVCICKCCQ